MGLDSVWLECWKNNMRTILGDSGDGGEGGRRARLLKRALGLPDRLQAITTVLERIRQRFRSIVTDVVAVETARSG